MQEEECKCANRLSLVLIDLLSENPVHCGFCRNEIDRRELPFTSKQIDRIDEWFEENKALYRHWLRSEENEAASMQKLMDPNSEVNCIGIGLARELSEILPTRMWFFSDPEAPRHRCARSAAISSRETSNGVQVHARSVASKSRSVCRANLFQGYGHNNLLHRSALMGLVLGCRGLTRAR